MTKAAVLFTGMMAALNGRCMASELYLGNAGVACFSAACMGFCLMGLVVQLADAVR